MARHVVLILAAMSCIAAEDGWLRVRELERGAELRIYKVKAKAPLRAKLERAGDESLIVNTGSGQESIPREEIERIDCRRAPSERLVKETRVDRKIAAKGAETGSNTIPGATTSVKTSLGILSKPRFEKIYDRKPAGR